MKLFFQKKLVSIFPLILLFNISADIEAQGASLVENFDNNQNKWFTTKNQIAYVGVQEGVYRITNYNKESSYMTWNEYSAIPTSGDFTVEAKMRSLKGSDRDGYGFTWGIDLPDLKNYYQFVISRNGGFQISGRQNENNIMIKDWSGISGPFNKGYNTLAVVQRQNEATYFLINGVVVYKTALLTYRGDVIGFGGGRQMMVEVDSCRILEGIPEYFQDSFTKIPSSEYCQDSLTKIPSLQGIKYSLGVNIQLLSPKLKTYLWSQGYRNGVYVADIKPGSPAEKQGLVKGDIIIKMDNTAVHTPPQVSELINASSGMISITIVRNDQPITRKIELEEIGSESLLGVSSGSSAENPEASITIHNVTLEPANVTPGGEFALKVEYTISDGTVPDEQIPFTLAYAIEKDGQVLLNRKSELSTPRGKKNISTKKGLIASKESGTYEIEVRLKYKKKFAGESARLIIQ